MSFIFGLDMSKSSLYFLVTLRCVAELQSLMFTYSQTLEKAISKTPELRTPELQHEHTRNDKKTLSLLKF